MEAQYVIIAFNIVTAIAGFFGGMVIRDLSSAVKELRKADTAMLNELRSSESSMQQNLASGPVKVCSSQSSMFFPAISNGSPGLRKRMLNLSM